MRIAQEFYCTKSGGGCGGYFVVKLNTALNGVVHVVCPKCKHKHQRCLSNGQIKEEGRWESNPVDTIEPTLAAYSEEPRTAIMRDRQLKELRDSVIFHDDLLRERWFEIHGAKT